MVRHKKMVRGCSVCGKKTIHGFKLCSSCRTYYRNKKRAYAKSTYRSKRHHRHFLGFRY